MASFLDLSLDVRYRIYAYANLVRSCPIELNSPYSYNQPVQPSPYGGIQFRTRNECFFARRKAGADYQTGRTASALNYLFSYF